jgi:hypothetical protein
MRALSRSLIVPAAVAVVLRLGSSGAFAQTAAHVGTAAIDHTTPKDVSVLMAHLQQQLVRVTGVATPRDSDVETLFRALEATRVRPVPREKMIALSQSLASALGTGVFEEVTLQRLAEDLLALLNNKALTADQASLAAIDVSAALQDLGIAERRVEIVLNALKGVCPVAVPATGTTNTDAAGQPKTPPKRSLLTLSRESSS